MTQFSVLLKKEFLESWRSFKFLWIPLVFIFLGVTEPLTNYYIEDILAAVGNMPEGFEMLFPELTAADILLSTTGQYQLIGLLVLISAFIGSVSRERHNGTATLLYVRPISAAVIFMSKWMMASIVSIVSAVLGYLASMYYTVILFGSVAVDDFVKMLLTYCVWLVLVMAITIAMSAAFQTGVAAAIAIILIPVGLFVDSAIGGFWTWTPWKLVNHGLSFVTDTIIMADFQMTLLFTVIAIISFSGLGILATKRNWRLTKV
ncbi:ABC transporter permease subunit [Metasolibacillus sp. FSL K6-0083]|uniref:ABC transporter permease n=1 Tax=Metasolibacillus sp. FSL K6-0083 TaxID=2921416 RepID=UPI0007959BD9|nr:ABC transporter permease [[Bacillus] sp. KCTC 13219]